MDDLENPNLFQPDGDFSVIDNDHAHSIQIRCPHCQAIGTFKPLLPSGVAYHKDTKGTSRSRFDYVEAQVSSCPNPKCNGLIFSLTHSHANEKIIKCFPPELLDFNPDNLPENLVQTLKEAVVCHSQGAYRACAMMVRRLLEELCHDCNVQGPNLHSRLKALRTHITLPEDLFDAMDELKALGNDAAHIEAKAFSTIDKEESQLSIELAQEILKARYQHKSLVDRLRSRRKSIGA
ncbi:DUF4145 domain-containing protein [Leisingera sp.]|jgi:hypothetical protein|uniref:DUF4145 domain-containing protein n=1 Tax=Leisingera sp. TaxID=1879318 RepID=UPI003A9225D3